MPDDIQISAEHQRLSDSQGRRADWKYWGPYLSERAWGTVREDYSPDGTAWDYFPHDHARSRAYRWNEDGLGGFCNRFQNICMGLALWNEHDPILKERLFGLSGNEGNHGEDVKEYYFYLDGLPSHAYMKMLYKYPQVKFPYTQLVEENHHRSRGVPEFELIDALKKEFEENRYFDVFIEYAKADQEDILCRITVENRGPEPAPIHILPHLWYRNTWSWGHNPNRPEIKSIASPQPDISAAFTDSRHLGERWWYVKSESQHSGNQPAPTLLFTENDTNYERLYDLPNQSPYVKDSFHETIVNGNLGLVNPDQEGSKAAAHIKANLLSGESITIKVRFSNAPKSSPFSDFDQTFNQRIRETEAFYTQIQPATLSSDQKLVQRQAFAGLLWSKQFYHYSVELWLQGDPAQPTPPPSRLSGRNKEWAHIYSLDVLSMPDKWEYPWYAAWDLAFHMVPLAMIDPEWAKRQLVLLTREWYLHPNGQLPAYEWAFGDVNPPVHAWAALQVYNIDRKAKGHPDTEFLERVFHKLLLNFTWWVNRKDHDGNNVFQGGFLGLDNIGVFDRSRPLPTGGHLDQADGTAWMAMYCLNMLDISLELARTLPAYEDVATKFFEHFIYIANAFYDLGHKGISLWDNKDGFFYDTLHTTEDTYIALKIRSFVGLIPLLATTTIEPEMLDKLPRFKSRVDWFLKYRPHLLKNVASLTEKGAHGHYQLSIVNRDKLARILERVFDPDEFLSDYGLRALSKYHADFPFVCRIDGEVRTVQYEPAESNSGVFGGNSNWRGPIWYPVNYMVIEALRNYEHHYGATLEVETPKGSGNFVSLDKAADELCRRLAKIFLQDQRGEKHRPVFGEQPYFQTDPHWRDYIPFFEYFHGDNGMGLGASHQTGWTALIAKMMQDLERN